MGNAGKNVGKASAGTIKMSVDTVLAQIGQLLRLADGLPHRALVEQTAGLRGVPSASDFEGRMLDTARTFGRYVDTITALLEQHAAALRAAVEEMGGADRDGQALLAVLDAAADQAGSTPTPVATTSQRPTSLR